MRVLGRVGYSRKVEKEKAKKTQEKKEEKTGKIQVSARFQKKIHAQEKYKIVDASF